MAASVDEVEKLMREVAVAQPKPDDLFRVLYTSRSLGTSATEKALQVAEIVCLLQTEHAQTVATAKRHFWTELAKRIREEGLATELREAVLPNTV
jgi:hypothetical protein